MRSKLQLIAFAKKWKFRCKNGGKLSIPLLEEMELAMKKIVMSLVTVLKYYDARLRSTLHYV